MEYTDEELIEIISSRGQWSEFDYVLATKILERRNVNVNDYNILNDSKKNEFVEITEEESIERSFINGNFAYSYFLAIIFGPYFLVRFFIIITAKERLENGNLVYKCDRKIRNHAIAICCIGLISSLIWHVISPY